MADTENMSELKTDELAKKEQEAKEKHGAAEQKRLNAIQQAREDFLQSKDPTMSPWKLMNSQVPPAEADADAMLVSTASRVFNKITTPGVYERRGGACRIALDANGRIRPLANDLLQGNRFGYNERFHAKYTEIARFKILHLKDPEMKIDWSSMENVGAKQLEKLLNICLAEGNCVKLGDNVEAYLQHLLAGGDAYKPAVSDNEDGPRSKREMAKSVALGEKLIALRNKVNANYHQKTKPLEKVADYRLAKEEFDQNKKLPEDGVARKAEIDDLFKDKDGKELSPEEQAKVMEDQVNKIDKRIEELDGKQTQLAAELDADSKTLDHPNADLSDFERIDTLMSGNVAASRDALLASMQEERDDLVVRRELLVEKLNDIPPPAPPRDEVEEKNINNMKTELDAETQQGAAPELPPDDEDIQHAVPDDLPPPPPPPRDDVDLDLNAKPDDGIPQAPPPPQDPNDLAAGEPAYVAAPPAAGQLDSSAPPLTPDKPAADAAPQPSLLEKLQQKLVESGIKLDKVADPAKGIEKIKTATVELTEKVQAKNENINTNTHRP